MATLLTIKATLDYTKPAVWRRLAVPDTLTFWELHFALQIAFGWKNSHLFEFRTGRGSTTDFLTGSPPVGPGSADYLPEWWRDPRQATLANILTAPKAKVSYVYDMGDNWEHTLVVEKLEPLPTPPPLVRCLAGRRAGPPEDSGGIPGYYQLLDVLAEKAAGQRKRLPSEFAGLSKYDPDDAELPSVNKHLASLPAIVAHEDVLLAAHSALAAALPRPARPTGDAILAALRARSGPAASPE